MVSFARVAVVALVLAFARPSSAESLKSKVKMANSNPVLPVVVDGEDVRLILTTDLDGILLCSDLPNGADTLVSPKIDFDYARRLLRFQLQGLIVQEFSVRDISVPALQYTGKMPIGSFAIRKQWLSPASIQYFLTGSRASGFIGVGFAFRPSRSHFWAMFNSDDGATSTPPQQQYSYRGFDTSSKIAALAARSPPLADEDEDGGETDNKEEAEVDFVNGFVTSASSSGGEGSRELQWSEPLAPIASDDEDANTQGVSFPIHRAFFRCVPTLTTEDEGSSLSSQTARDVDIFGEFSGNWDVVLDFNVPCLVLPQQFFDALTGWLGLRYNSELKLAEIASSTPLPDLVFAMALDGPQLSIPLQRLVLSELAVAANTSNGDASSSKQSGLTRLCIQRSGSIIQNGAAMFSPLDQDVGSAQRYRVHSSLSLPLFNMFQEPVVFGAMVLNSFDEVAVDGDAKQTGLRSRGAARLSGNSTLDSEGGGATTAAAFATCLRPTECVGQQQFIHRTNACQDPDCSLYYFHYLDTASKQCVVDTGWTKTLGVTLAVFLAVEALVSLSLSRLLFASRTERASFLAHS